MDDTLFSCIYYYMWMRRYSHLVAFPPFFSKIFCTARDGRENENDDEYIKHASKQELFYSFANICNALTIPIYILIICTFICISISEKLHQLLFLYVLWIFAWLTLSTDENCMRCVCVSVSRHTRWRCFSHSWCIWMCVCVGASVMMNKLHKIMCHIIRHQNWITYSYIDGEH